MSLRFLFVPAAVVALCCAAVAQNRPPLDDADVAATRIFQRTASTGMVVVIVRDKQTWFKGYGRVTPVSNDVPQANSLVRLCSITKILATDMLGKLVADKTVSFDDPLQKWAPDKIQVPTMTVRGPAARPVNLGDLATHTAGLPREIAYPPAGMAHFTFPDFEYRWSWLPQFRLRTSPGDAAHYSNIGFDLLADALSAATNEPYQKLFQERTAMPLGMVDTTLMPSENQCARLMSGAREPSECTDTQAAAGSGGMYSTADDMARFMRYLLYLPGVPVHQNGISTGIYLDPTKLKSVQGLGHAGVPDGLGLGWLEINKEYGESRIVEKTGGGAGFQTYIALDPARHAGIFVAVTQGRSRGATNMFRDANDLLLSMVGLPPVPVDPNDPERERTAEELEEAAKARPRGRAGRAMAGAKVRPGLAAARGRAVLPARGKSAAAGRSHGVVATKPKVGVRHTASPAARGTAKRPVAKKKTTRR